MIFMIESVQCQRLKEEEKSEQKQQKFRLSLRQRWHEKRSLVLNF